MGQIILVIGGARSGKSDFAERFVLHQGKRCAYIATAEILDEEMAARVKAHRERRQHGWLNFEAPYKAEQVLAEAGSAADSILFDCVTMYVCNLLYGEGAPDTVLQRADRVKQAIDELLLAAKDTGKTVVFVANEVGTGIVPDNAMAREYRDVAGSVNQQIGQAAERVFYVVAGQAVDMKALAYKFE